MSRRGALDAAGAVSATATHLIEAVRDAVALTACGEMLAELAGPAPSVCPMPASESTLASLVAVVAPGRTRDAQPTPRPRRAGHGDGPAAPQVGRHRRDGPGSDRTTPTRDGPPDGPPGRVPSRPDRPDRLARRPRGPATVPPPQPLSADRLRAAAGPSPIQRPRAMRGWSPRRHPTIATGRPDDGQAATTRPPIVGSPVARAAERVAERVAEMLPDADSRLAGLTDATPRPGPAAPARLLDRAARQASRARADRHPDAPDRGHGAAGDHDRSWPTVDDDPTPVLSTDATAPPRPRRAAREGDGPTPDREASRRGDHLPVTPSDGLHEQPAPTDRPRSSMPWSPAAPTPPGPEADHPTPPAGWPVTPEDLEQRLQQVLDDAARRHGIEV